MKIKYIVPVKGTDKRVYKKLYLDNGDTAFVSVDTSYGRSLKEGGFVSQAELKDNQACNVSIACGVVKSCAPTVFRGKPTEASRFEQTPNSIYSVLACFKGCEGWVNISIKESEDGAVVYVERGEDKCPKICRCRLRGGTYVVLGSKLIDGDVLHSFCGEVMSIYPDTIQIDIVALNGELVECKIRRPNLKQV